MGIRSKYPMAAIVFACLLVALMAVPAVGGNGTDLAKEFKEASDLGLPLADGYWTKIHNGPDNGNDVGNAIACDQQGNAFAAGSQFSTLGGNELWIRKYSGVDGSTLWTRTYHGPVPGPGDDGALSVACDPAGNVAVAGFSFDGVTYNTFVRKYNGADGSILWTKIFDSTFNDRGWGVTFDVAGNAFVAGATNNATNRDIWVRKYNGADGETIWTKIVDSGFDDQAYAVSCDANGDAAVVGMLSDATTTSTWVRKYDGTDGSTIWTRTFDGGVQDFATCVSFDNDGNPVVGAYNYTGGATYNLWVRKYRGSNGATIWTRIYDAPSHVAAPWGLACDALNDPVVAGFYRNAAGNWDIMVRKYRGSDGAEIWTQTYAGPGAGADAGRGVSIDQDGNPFVVGTITNTAGNTDIWVRKYPPAEHGSSVWFMAEGTTAWGFEEYISIENPNAVQVHTDVLYYTPGGAVVGPTVTLAPYSQATVRPADTLGNTDFSTRVACQERLDIAVDRTMSWTGYGAASQEGHSSIGITFPAKTWYLAEGSSNWGFECWLLIQNPNAQDASCNMTFMVEGEAPVSFPVDVLANSRQTFDMSVYIGQKDASILVTSDVPVIPERAMYRNDRREGHDSIGTKTPTTDYYLAEGTTAWGFTTYVLVQNPNDVAADVTVTYMTPAGPQVAPTFSMQPNSRYTIRVNDTVPNTDLSTRVQSNLPIIAERAMYWSGPTGEACHDSIGMSRPHAIFWLPDGDTSNGRETWTLVQNPNDVPVDVLISYLTPTGTGNVVFNDTIGPNSRKTYNMADRLQDSRASISVVCNTVGRNIMVERAMYWNSRGAGTDTIGGYAD